jgi:hypothetical protein
MDFYLFTLGSKLFFPNSFSHVVHRKKPAPRILQKKKKGRKFSTRRATWTRQARDQPTTREPAIGPRPYAYVAHPSVTEQPLPFTGDL